MGLFTIEFELGRETRGMVERVAAQVCATAERIAAGATATVELGPETLGTIAAGREGSKEGGPAVGAIVAKAQEKVKGVTGA